MKRFENFVWDLLFIIVGGIIILNVLGFTDIKIFFDGWWTIFIIIPCFIGLFKDDDKTGSIIGLIIGIVALLVCQDVLEFDLVWKLLLPVILIVIGVTGIFKNVLGGKVNKEIKNLNEKTTEENACCATFSNQKVKLDGQKFKNANLTAVFGAVEYDLTNAIIESDCIINATSIFGGIDITVPANVKVKTKSASIFGGITDKKQHAVNEDAHTIYINSTCMFGGVEIK